MQTVVSPTPALWHNPAVKAYVDAVGAAYEPVDRIVAQCWGNRIDDAHALASLQAQASGVRANVATARTQLGEALKQVTSGVARTHLEQSGTYLEQFGHAIDALATLTDASKLGGYGGALNQADHLGIQAAVQGIFADGDPV